MKIGYARVSTREQHLDMQLEALRAAGCEKIFSEKMTGHQQNRPELDACLNFLREGDTLVVYKLDRLGRSLKNILTLLEDFKNKGILFTSLQDSISTEGATGQLMANILGAFAQFERDLIYERTQEGRRIAKEKGVKFGRKTLINKNNIAKHKQLFIRMVASWREKWALGEFPFYYVQIAPYQYSDKQASPIGAAELRQAQLEAMTIIPNSRSEERRVGKEC